MTFPTIPTVAASRVLTTTQANTTATRTFPDLSGLTAPTGDLIIAIVVAYQTSTGTDAAFSGWGGSFTEFHDSATSTTMAIGAAYKWSSGSETGTFSVTQAGTITGHASMILLSISGAHVSTPPEAGSRASDTTAAADPVSFNPAGWDAEDTLWIAVGGAGETATGGAFTGWAASPTNYSGDVATGISGDVVGGVEAGVGFRQLNAAAEDVGGASVDTSNARNAAVVIAVRPAPADYTQTPGDALALTDPLSLEPELGRTDPLPLADTRSLEQGLGRVDTLALSDSASTDLTGGGIERTPTDTLPLTDATDVRFLSKWTYAATVRVGG